MHIYFKFSLVNNFATYILERKYKNKVLWVFVRGMVRRVWVTVFLMQSFLIILLMTVILEVTVCCLQRLYRERLVIAVAQSTQRILLVAQGQGLEPKLEFSTSEVKLGPVLPYSNGEEVEVLVRNPCPFPIEFYSLDFDKQYLEEERVTGFYTLFEQQVWLDI